MIKSAKEINEAKKDFLQALSYAEELSERLEMAEVEDFVKSKIDEVNYESNVINQSVEDLHQKKEEIIDHHQIKSFSIARIKLNACFLVAYIIIAYGLRNELLYLFRNNKYAKVECMVFYIMTFLIFSFLFNAIIKQISKKNDSV